MCCLYLVFLYVLYVYLALTLVLLTFKVKYYQSLHNFDLILNLLKYYQKISNI